MLYSIMWAGHRKGGGGHNHERKCRIQHISPPPPPLRVCAIAKIAKVGAFLRDTTVHALHSPTHTSTHATHEHTHA